MPQQKEFELTKKQLKEKIKFWFDFVIDCDEEEILPGGMFREEAFRVLLAWDLNGGRPPTDELFVHKKKPMRDAK